MSKHKKTTAHKTTPVKPIRLQKATPGKMALVAAGVAAVATGLYLTVTKKGNKASSAGTPGGTTAPAAAQAKTPSTKPVSTGKGAAAKSAAPKSSASKAGASANKSGAKGAAAKPKELKGAAKNVDVALNNEVASHTEHNPNNADQFTDDGATGNAD